MGDLLFPLFPFMIPKFGRIDYFYYLCSTTKYPTFRINEDDHFQVWGVVAYC